MSGYRDIWRCARILKCMTFDVKRVGIKRAIKMLALIELA